MVSFALCLASVALAVASTFLPLRISNLREVFWAASLPVALQETLIRLAPPLTLQLSLIASAGFGTGVGVGVGFGVTVGVGVGVGVEPGGAGSTTPVVGSIHSFGATGPALKSNKCLSPPYSSVGRASKDWSPIGGRPQLSSMNFRIDVCSSCV